MSPFRGSHTPPKKFSGTALLPSQTIPFIFGTREASPAAVQTLFHYTRPLREPAPSVSYAGFSSQELQPGPAHGAPLGPGPHLRD